MYDQWLFEFIQAVTDGINSPKMPPKAAASTDGDNAFLVVCIKCAKDKLTVDFDSVAHATGMSKGGAQ